jgi:hypothetical protein
MNIVKKFLASGIEVLLNLAFSRIGRVRPITPHRHTDLGKDNVLFRTVTDRPDELLISQVSRNELEGNEPVSSLLLVGSQWVPLVYDQDAVRIERGMDLLEVITVLNSPLVRLLVWIINWQELGLLVGELRVTSTRFEAGEETEKNDSDRAVSLICYDI